MKKTNDTILVNENLTQKIEYPALITIYQYQGSCQNSLQVKLATAAPPPPQKKTMVSQFLSHHQDLLLNSTTCL